MPQERVPTLDEAGVLLGKFLPGYLDEVTLNATIDSRTAASVASADADRVAAETAQAAAAASAAQAATSASGATQVAVAGAMPVLFTNHIVNPSVEVNATTNMSTVSGATISRVTSEFRFGAASVQVVCDGTSPAQGVTFTTPIVPAGVYSASAWVKAPAGTPMQMIGRRLNNQGNAQVSHQFTATGDWQRVVATGFVNDASSIIDAQVRTSGSSNVAATFYVDGVMVVAGTDVPDYFDGSTLGCAWTGTAHASASIKYALNAADSVTKAALPTLTRNLIANPSFEIDTTGWGLPTGNGVQTVSRQTSTPYVGVARLQVVCDGATIGQGIQGISGRVTPGQTYTGSVSVMAPAGRAMQLSLRWINTAGAGVDPIPGVAFTASGTWDRVQITGTAPVGADRVFLRVAIAQAVATTMSVDAAQLEVGARASAYTDGDQKGCYWTGTPHASESVRMVRGEDGVAKSDLPELARNLLLNPGVEGTESTRFLASDGNCTTVRTALAARTGSSSLAVTATSAGTAIAGHSTIDGFTRVTPGRSYTYVFYSRAATAARSIEARLYWSGGAPSNGIATTNSTSGWTRHVVTGVAPAGVTNVRGAIVITGAGAGEVHYLDDQLLVEGAAPVDQFDGDSAGCMWLGARWSSESIRFAHSASEYNLLTWLDAGRAQGVGSPEGVVTATVGTRYVDTLATNGAIEWIKESGTGTTGWKVVYGDTGWRDISTLCVNGWTAPVGGFLIRKTPDQVQVRINALNAASATSVRCITYPTGFFAIPGGGLDRFLLHRADAPVTVRRTYGTTTLDVSDYQPSDILYGSFSYASNTQWPTTLPGTPA